MIVGLQALRHALIANGETSEGKLAAKKGLRSSEGPEEPTPGAEAHADSIGLLPGINPRPTARLSFSTASKTLVNSRLS
jgi:hypothetical protein